MESKHKNALIGALLAVVFVMAVGYAAFAQQLTINGTAEITSKWDVHFDPIVVGTDVTSTMTAVSTTSGESVVPITISKPAVAAPGTKGSIAYSQNNQVATISATLIQPGDTVTFKLKPHNYGTGLNAKGTATVAAADGQDTVCSGNTCTDGYIKFEVTPTLSNSLAPEHADEITVVASYEEPETNATDTGLNTAGIKVTLNYVQV